MKRLNCDVFILDGKPYDVDKHGENAICITGNFYAGNGCKVTSRSIDALGSVFIENNVYTCDIIAEGDVGKPC